MGFHVDLMQLEHISEASGCSFPGVHLEAVNWFVCFQTVLVRGNGVATGYCLRSLSADLSVSVVRAPSKTIGGSSG
jgi:hypothetical protein